MKISKTRKTYCPKCKKHTQHKISEVKGKERGSLKKGSIQRALKRGRGQGFGNKGKYGSKPPISKWKRAGAKTSKKMNLKLTCSTCKKSTIRSGKRIKKLEIQ